MRIFDRYVLREVLLPLLLSLVLLTFLLIIPPLLKDAYKLIATGIEPWIVARVLVLLLPSALSISIPMAVLLGLLIAFGRLSADREFVAMQACGVSIYRLLRPVALIAALGVAGTLYVMIVALPDANQAFREITFGEVAQRVENQIKPRVLFNTFPNHVLYVRDLTANHELRDVFFADSSRPDVTTVYLAREGRVVVDRVNKFVQLQLTHGMQHTTRPSAPDEYQGTEFETLSLSLDATTVFAQPPARGAPEMTIAELHRTIAETKPGDHLFIDAQLMIQYKYSFPAACAVLALVALGLGVSNRKDGKLASFAIGFIVVFVYYVLLYTARAAAFGGKLSPNLAPWVPVIVLSVFGVALTIWRARSTDRPMFITFWVNRASQAASNDADGDDSTPLDRSDLLVGASSGLRLPGLKILDLYTVRQYLNVFVLAVLSALGVFYISTFIDLADKLFRGKATTSMLLQFFYYQTPQFLYFIIPIAVLVSTLVTIGVMTKTSELVVMKACGRSLYRAAAPLVLCAVGAGAALFGLQEVVLARAQRHADRLEGAIRGWPSQEPSAINRWIASDSGDIYHYDLFDPARDQFIRFTRYRFDTKTWRLREVRYSDAIDSPTPTKDAMLRDWTARKGWVRTLTTTRTHDVAKTTVSYVPFSTETMTFERPDYFKAELPDPAKMNYRQLRLYIAQLKASGFNTVSAMVQLQRKVAFPFTTVIMALLAIPFAVTTGRRGAMYGIGIGIALSIVYWVIFQVFSAIGEGGVLTPTLAAWTANILFGAAALYGILTVRT